MGSAVTIIAGILAIAGAISTIGGAANWIVTLIQALKAPNADQNRRLTELEEHLKRVDGFLDVDKKRLDNIDQSTRVTQRALLALLAHGIDGNHQQQMEEAKEELQSHLINR